MFLKKSTRDLVDSAKSQNLGENISSLRDSAKQNRGNPSIKKTQNLNKNNSVRSTQTRPLRGAKNRIQGCSSATADFLLEAEKRGSPPKSEKAAAFWRVGGAGRGVQPFLREKISEISGEGIAESIRDSSPTAQNDNFILNLTLFAESPQIPTKYALKG